MLTGKQRHKRRIALRHCPQQPQCPSNTPQDKMHQQQQPGAGRGACSYCWSQYSLDTTGGYKGERPKRNPDGKLQEGLGWGL